MKSEEQKHLTVLNTRQLHFKVMTVCRLLHEDVEDVIQIYIGVVNIPPSELDSSLKRCSFCLFDWLSVGGDVFRYLLFLTSKEMDFLVSYFLPEIKPHITKI